MKFEKYQHIERLGTDKVNGILNGKVYVYPKIDGTNTSIFLGDDGEVCVGGRESQLSEEKDNYYAHRILSKVEKYAKFFAEYPSLRLYGEFLVPVNIKSYRKDAWKKFYVFDVMDGDRYLTYEEYKPLLEKYDIEYIPVLEIFDNPSKEQLYAISGSGMFLQADGGKPEGIVIKNYDYRNYAGKQIWAKIISSEYNKKSKVNTIAADVHEQIIFVYVTEHFIEKEFEKFLHAVNGEYTQKTLPRFFSSIWHTLIDEEMWNIIKKFKNPVIDFGRLKGLMMAEIKKVKPELFE